MSARTAQLDNRLGAAALPALAVALVAGCVAGGPAPVVDRAQQAKPGTARPAAPAGRSGRAAVSRNGFHTVRRGETLYSIALDYGVDYRDMVRWNGITDPAAIRAGQVLRTTAPVTGVATAPFKSAPVVEARPIAGAGAGVAAEPETQAGIKAEPQAVRLPYSDQAYAQLASVKTEPVPRQDDQQPAREPGADGPSWTWPAVGKVTSAFNGATNKGIDVAGRPGQPVFASANGQVIFSGSASGSLSQLGKFVVIKHSSGYNSVYAHNRALHVKEGQTVAKGQKIAEMGSADAADAKLHFEIRRYGKPIDPLTLLPHPPG